MNVAVLIPAYRPGPALVELARALSESGLAAIVVVDDGSGPEYAGLFDELRQFPNVTLLRHAVNLGKGAALKTAINHALCEWPAQAGAVTADADGQHHPEDILRVARRLAAEPEKLVLGARRFGGGVPLRSRFGNSVTRGAVRLLLGQRLGDTQTGLRGIPRALLPQLLRIASNGYEFELDMLITAKHHGCAVAEEPVRTIYEPGNRSSHFNPLLDSMRIYFVLLRFSAVALVTALLDNVVFFFAWGWTGSVIGSQAAGRGVAMLFNYGAARRAVFLSNERHRATLPKYLALVGVNGALSYALIRLLSENTALPVIGAKFAAEGLLFIASFVIQRDFIFTRRPVPGGATDWDRYYRSTPWTARLTRRYTAAVLARALRRFAKPGGEVVELGGANSCFLDRVRAELRPRAYHVVDTNEYGLELLRGRGVELHRQDALALDLPLAADVVFSVGLIEHFGSAHTRRCVAAHLDLLKPGGCAIISFPTPTWLYRAARWVMESIGAWKFPDERPLDRSEVLDAVRGRGDVLFEKTLWPVVFTQHLIVVRKTA